MSVPFPAAAAPATTAPAWQRMAAQLVSVLLHPLFVPAALVWLMLYQHPMYHLFTDGPLRLRIFAMVVLNTVLFPALVVFLLWRLKFISSVQLHTQRERIMPLTISIVFYFWAFYVGRNLESIPPAMQQWLVGVFLGSCAAMFTNIFFKISLHTLAAGGAVAFMLLQVWHDAHWPLHWLLLACLLAGLAGTARLLRGAHQPGEVYGGYLAGAICQVAAMLVLS